MAALTAEIQYAVYTITILNSNVSYIMPRVLLVTNNSFLVCLFITTPSGIPVIMIVRKMHAFDFCFGGNLLTCKMSSPISLKNAVIVGVVCVIILLLGIYIQDEGSDEERISINASRLSFGRVFNQSFEAYHRRKQGLPVVSTARGLGLLLL